jgi:subtilisin family serine protease
MSKSKSKSKSKSLNFPNSYWDPEFKIYTYYPNFLKHYAELKAIKLGQPAREGDKLSKEIQELLKKQNNFEERKRRREEILNEATALSENYAKALLIGPESSRSVFPLMNAMNDISLIAVMHFKEEFARARPNQVEPAIQPLLPVPGHPSYPSGHSTQNFLIAHALAEVIGDDAKLIARIFDIARRVAVNREWAGLHYPSDTAAGEKLARRLFPIVRQVFANLIDDAVEEWQESADDDTEPKPGGAGSTASPAHAQSELPWHLRNTGHNEGKEGKAGIDIGIEGAWKITKGDNNVRVVLLDMAVNLDHESLVEHIDFDNVQNLDYDDPPPEDLCLSSVEGLLASESQPHPQLTGSQIKLRKFLNAFASRSSAHGTACAGVIVGDHKIASPCKGIAPGCKIAPYRAMTRTEPTRKARQFLAQKVLEIPGLGLGEILLCPLPLDPLPSDDVADQPAEQDGNGGVQPDTNGSAPRTSVDPLVFAFAFAATKIPVILPSGNDGTSRLSPLFDQIESPSTFESIKSVDDVAELLDWDRAKVERLLKIHDDKGLAEFKEAIRRKETGVITVGACNNRGYRSRYSQFGGSQLIVAPSDDVLPPEGPPGTDRETVDEMGAVVKTLGTLSIATADGPGRSGYVQGASKYTTATNEYGFGGTSAAAAEVAGIVALMLSANRKLKPSEVRRLLQKSASLKPLERKGGLDDGDYDHEFGFGLVDAGTAVLSASKK